MPFEEISVNNKTEATGDSEPRISRLASRRERQSIPASYFLIGGLILAVLLLLFLFRDGLLGAAPTQQYVDKIDGFHFNFLPKYDLDASLESVKRYGKDYLVGFKEKNDPRIGCEVRRRDVALDISRPLLDIQREIIATASGKTRFTTLSGQKAVRLEMDITDPLGAVISIRQVYLPRGGQTYLLQCGAGKAYFDKFAPDFELFFNSFSF